MICNDILFFMQMEKMDITLQWDILDQTFQNCFYALTSVSITLRIERIIQKYSFLQETCV